MTTEFLDDTPLTLEQSQFLMGSLEKELQEQEEVEKKRRPRRRGGLRRRPKRKVINFENFPASKWTDSVPDDGVVVVPFKFDGTHGKILV